MPTNPAAAVASANPAEAAPARDPANEDAPAYELIELLFFAYRDFVADPDRILAEYGFGRAHHRVLHFVDRHPGLTIAELLDILRITKQSLNRVLKELVEKGFVEQRAGTADRRQRLLTCTAAGRQLAARLALMQTRRVRRALAGQGPEMREAARSGASSPAAPPTPVTEGARAGFAARAGLADGAAHILVVDDDRRLRDLLGRFLMEQGFRVSTAASAAEARAKSESFVFDALVLDVMMPGETGFEYARSVRETSRVPILMLTARSNPNDRVAGLEIGADDYLPKPFEPRELVLRLANILRRTRAETPRPAAAPDVVRFGPFTFRPERGDLRRDEEAIRLSEREREILTILSLKRGGNVEREALTGPGSGAGERTIDVQINRLRRKIEVDPANPAFLQTVRGIGYRLVVD